MANLDSEQDLSGPDVGVGVPDLGYQTDDPLPNDDDVVVPPVDTMLESDPSTDEGEGAE